MHRCIDAETRAMGNDRSGKGMNDGMDGKRMNEYAVDRSINERDRGIKRFKGGRKNRNYTSIPSITPHLFFFFFLNYTFSDSV
jgi:hypothetical protein